MALFASLALFGPVQTYKLPTTHKVTVGFIKINEVVTKHTHRRDHSKEDLERIWSSDSRRTKQLFYSEAQTEQKYAIW